MTLAPAGLLAAQDGAAQHDGTDRGDHDVHPLTAHNRRQIIFGMATGCSAGVLDHNSIT
jgi:hypothetical protein